MTTRHGLSFVFVRRFNCLAVDEGVNSERFMRKKKDFGRIVQAAVPTALGLYRHRSCLWHYRFSLSAPVEMGLMSLFVYAGAPSLPCWHWCGQAPVATIAMTVF